MIKFEHYFCREVGDPKLFINVDWYKFEDTWHTTYGMGGFAAWEPEEMERKKKLNDNRHKWWTLRLNICGLLLAVEVRLYKVGNKYHGSLRDSEKIAQGRREMLERRRKVKK